MNREIHQFRMLEAKHRELLEKSSGFALPSLVVHAVPHLHFFYFCLISRKARKGYAECARGGGGRGIL